MKTLYVATKNAHKLTEIGAILEGFDVRSAYEGGLELEVEETGETFEENAALKAVTLSSHLEGLVIADDSGIVVDALDGAPGVYSARYAGAKATDAENNALLLKNMSGVENRSARFLCVIALARGGRLIATFSGKCEGSIASEPKGAGGFGYDPLLVLEDGRSVAELSPEEKNLISHRKKALTRLKEFLEQT